MSGIDIFYMNGSRIWARTQNATCVPKAGDFIAINNIKYIVKEVIWHIENPAWVEVQIEQK